MVPQVELFSFVFWENWETPKRHFEINRPLDYFYKDGTKMKIPFEVKPT